MLLKTCLILMVCLTLGDGQLFANFPLRAARKIQERLRDKLSLYRERTRERTTQMVCYDVVGCFRLPHKNSPLQKVPEDPAILATTFYLFTRKNRTQPEVLHYGDDGTSLKLSSFNVFKPLKVLIHGYTSKWNEPGALQVKDAYLELYDCNVVLVDWKNGARGPHYASAAANTELVGRELGILLVSMVESGLSPRKVHLIGFSLGAHVAGAASEPLKAKGQLIGRITGLDAASPLFRTNHFKEKNKKLDRSDAIYVDVLHTDSSPVSGNIRWKKLMKKPRIVVFNRRLRPVGAHRPRGLFPEWGAAAARVPRPPELRFGPQLEGGKLSREAACSHIRAFHLFIETITSKLSTAGASTCQFTAYNCPGGMPAFERGHCFPLIDKSKGETGQFGEDVRGEGIMFFSTRDSSPYCGTQLQASVHVSQRTTSVKGVLQVVLFYPNNSVTFHIETNTKDLVMSGARMDGIAVARYDSLDPLRVGDIHANLHFFNVQDEGSANQTLASWCLYTDKIVVRDMLGNSWQHCEKDLMVSESSPKRLILSTAPC